ncbi:hypothetical protein AB0N92_17855 [Streptomyces sp. NPDC093248]|uniref:hypothetical protein n=1 Tax=Streptomyces sp. NPDC093248 TaxID=3155072 RepID=UPI003425F1E8
MGVLSGTITRTTGRERLMRYAWRRSLCPLPADTGESVAPFRGRPDDDGAQLGLDELRDVPVVVVLGERGAGKSVMLEQEHTQLTSGEVAAAALHLGRDVFDTTSASSRLNQLLHGPAGAVRHVLLDGLDEGLSDIPGLDKALAVQLQDMEPQARQGLRLRITCRTTRWPEKLESQLRALWPDPGQVALMTLAPLTRDDVQSAAEQRGLDGANFSQQVTSRGLEALVQQPVTLIPLLDAQALGEELPKTMAEAYDQACRTLFTETWSEGFDQRQDRPPADHLLEVSRWVAAALQFSGSAAVVDQEPTHTGELHLDLLSGPEVPGLLPHLSCHRRELLHLTESSLLAPVGQRRWVFAHRSYQEHLAAQYLHDRIEPAVRGELLWVGSGQARHILPEHEEIAARLAVHDPHLFDDLLAHDPRVLVLADLPAVPADRREQTVHALLTTASDESFERLDTNLLQRLKHPELARQLKPFLIPGMQWAQMYLALWIAATCRPAGLTPALLSLAQETGVPTRLRSLALYAIDEETDKSDETVARLRELASGDRPSVAEAALEHLWPLHLQLTEYLDLLAEQQPGKSGRALHSLMDQVAAEHFDEALEWSIAALEAQSQSALLATAVLGRCVGLLGQEGCENPDCREQRVGRALLALAAYPELSDSVDSYEAFHYLQRALEGAPSTRRRLAEHVLRNGSHEHAQELIFDLHVGLFPAQDRLYWAERWPQLSQEMRRTAQPLISRRPRPAEGELRQAVDRALRVDAELRQATAWWEAPPPQWLRRSQQREEEQRRRNTFDESEFTAALEAAEAAEPAEVRTAWLTVIQHLYRTADGSRAERSLVLGAIAAAPSCPPQGSVLHGRLLAVALHVLRTVPALSASDLAAWGTVWPDAPELAAAGWVPADARETAVPVTDDVSRWAGWALALATMTPAEQDQAARRALFEQCVRHAGAAFEDALAQSLQRLDSHRLADLIVLLHALRDPDALNLVRAWAAEPGRSPASWSAVLVTLAHLDDSEALAHVQETVAAGPTDSDTDRERWVVAVTALMSFPVLPDNWPQVRRALEDDSLFRAVVDHVMADFDHHPRAWASGVSALSEADLADLYRRLCRREELQQPRPAHEPGVAYTITPQETLHDLAESLPLLIADKGTQQAADHLSRLAESAPLHSAWLLRLARSTARQAASRQAAPLPVPQLRKLAADHSLRVVTDEVQLLDVVMETLDKVQEALSGPNGMGILVWNRAASGGGSSMWPMWEEDFSDLVMGLLKIHLGGRRIILNREVQVDRPGAGGGRTDIHIQAADPSQAAEPFTVVIECKGCWNRELPTALSDQLVARYLRRPRTAGIFLVGFFDCDLWDSEQRPCCSPRHTRQQIEHEQQQLAAQYDVPVRARVLDCRPPGAQIG